MSTEAKNHKSSALHYIGVLMNDNAIEMHTAHSSSHWLSAFFPTIDGEIDYVKLFRPSLFFILFLREKRKKERIKMGSTRYYILSDLKAL